MQGRQAKKNARFTSDSEIDFSDIPELTNAQLKKARRVGRPKSGREPKRLIAIRIDPTLLSKLQHIAKNSDKHYQTLIHELLEKSVKEAA